MRTWQVAVLLLATAGTPLRAEPVVTSRQKQPAGDRKGPPAKRPPDVRNGEAYDGRAPRRPSARALQAVPRALLFLPRVAAAVVGRTVVAAVDWWEQSGVGPFFHRVCFAFDGRLTVLPLVVWERGQNPVAGAALTTDLLFGRARRAGLHLEAAAGHAHVWHALLKLYPLGKDGQGTHRAQRPHRLRLTIEAGFARRDDLPYFGVGYRRPGPGATAAELESRLGSEVFQGGATLRVRLWGSAFLGLGLGADWRRLSDGRSSLEAEPISRLYGTDHAGWATGVLTFVPALLLGAGGDTGGLLPAPGIRGQVSAAARVGDDDVGRHLSLKTTLEAFVGLGGGYRRLGLRAHLEATIRLDSRPIPLLHLPTLGGPDTMRGFASGRFRGEAVALLQLEYHMALHRRLWLSLFIDWGGAFREGFKDASAEAVDVSGGGALSLRIAPDNWMRLLVAGSRDGALVYIAWRGAP
ncbi:MAG: BamA/TamA family outer membrane protein [bacterium]